VNAELWQEPAADESAGNTYDEITDEPKAGALDDLTCEPSGNKANNEYDKQTVTRHMHRHLPGFIETGKRLIQERS
jgi:hypothetical protein